MEWKLFNPGVNSRLEQGAVVPSQGRIITLGRRADNSIVLSEPFASGYHAKDIC